jgi:hypothetical protein
MQSKSESKFYFTKSTPFHYFFFLRAQYKLSGKAFLCTRTLAKPTEFCLVSEKHIITTTKLEQYKMNLSILSDGLQREMDNYEATREVTRRNYHFYEQAKELMKSYELVGGANHTGMLTVGTGSDEYSIENLFKEMKKSLKRGLQSDEETALHVISSNYTKFKKLKEYVDSTILEIKFILDIIEINGNVSIIENVFDKTMDNMFQIYENEVTENIIYPIYSSAVRISRDILKYKEFEPFSITETIPKVIAECDTLIELIQNEEYDAFNKAMREDFEGFPESIEEYKDELCEKITSLFNINGVTFGAGEDDDEDEQLFIYYQQ